MLCNPDVFLRALETHEKIKYNKLEDFLRKNRGEVLKMVWYEYNEEEYIRDEKEISRKDGRFEDMKRAAENEAYQAALFEKFNL